MRIHATLSLGRRPRELRSSTGDTKTNSCVSSATTARNFFFLSRRKEGKDATRADAHNVKKGSYFLAPFCGSKKSFFCVPFHVDFVSLDIEGTEVPLLACWPWKKMSPLVWTIEINQKDNEMLIDEIMLSNGYIKYDRLDYSYWKPKWVVTRLDAIYVRRDFLGLESTPFLPFKRDVPYFHKQTKKLEQKWDRWKIYTRCDMSRGHKKAPN